MHTQPLQLGAQSGARSRRRGLRGRVVALSTSLSGLAAAALLVCGGVAPARAQGGIPLGTGGLGGFGAVPPALTDLVAGLTDGGPLSGAISLGQALLAGLQDGEVPLMGALSDAFHGDVTGPLADAFTVTGAPSTLLESVDASGAIALLQGIRDILGHDAPDVSVAVPFGRLLLSARDNGVSACATLVGPAGIRLTIGVSSAQQLCGQRGPNFANPTGAVTAFVDIANLRASLQNRAVLAPDLVDGHLFAVPAITFEGVLYAEANGHWLQTRFVENDPATQVLEGTLSLGMKLTFDDILEAEVGGTVNLSLKLRPNIAVEVLGAANLAMLDAADALGLAPGEAPSPGQAAQIVAAGLARLHSELESRGEGSAELTFSVAATATLGLGVWDTFLSVLYAEMSFNVTADLAALADVPVAVLEDAIRYGLGTGHQIGVMYSAVAAGDLSQVLGDNAGAWVAWAREIGTTALTELYEYLGTFELGIYSGYGALGGTGGGSDPSDDAPRHIPVYDYTLDLDVGDLLDAFLPEPEKVGETIANALINGATLSLRALLDAKAASAGVADWLNLPFPAGTHATSAPPRPTAGDLRDIAVEALDAFRVGIDFNGPNLRVGLENVPYGIFVDAFLTSADGSLGLVLGAALAARDGDVDILRNAASSWLDAQEEAGLTLARRFFQEAIVRVTKGAGATIDIGAEVTASLGFGVNVSGLFKLSALLLAAFPEVYDEEQGEPLFQVSLPVSASVGLGLSIGEGVEVVLSGEVSGGRSLADLSVKNWDAAFLPLAPPFVAGFEVLDFDGAIETDGAFAGSGYLLLPQGGLVAATFAVDGGGHVVSGTWNGVIGGGPLGTLEGAGGVITDAGLRFDHALAFGPVTADVHFLLAASGRLSGTFQGDLVIYGVTFASADLALAPNGAMIGAATVSVAGQHVDALLDLGPGLAVGGHVAGTVDLFGFALDLSLELDASGLNGSGLVTVPGLGTLSAQDVGIDANHMPHGTFHGDLNAAGVAFTATDVMVYGTYLRGRTELDVPGLGASAVALTLGGGRVTGTVAAAWPAFGLGSATLDLSIDGHAGIAAHGTLDADFLGAFDDLLTAQLQAALDAASLARDVAVTGLGLAQSALDDLDVVIAATYEAIRIEREAAAEVLGAAEAAASAAAALVNDALDQIGDVNRYYAPVRAAAQGALDAAQRALDTAKGVVAQTLGAIQALDRWYNGLDPVRRFFAAGPYAAARAALLAQYTAAQGALAAAQGAFDVARSALTALDQEIQQALAGLNTLLAQRRAAYDEVLAALDAARAAALALADPSLDPRILALMATRSGLEAALNLASRTLAAATSVTAQLQTLFDWLKDRALDSLVNIVSASFDAGLQSLGSGHLTIVVVFELAGERHEASVALDLNAPGAAIADLVNALEPAVQDIGVTPADDEEPVTGWTDTTPPTTTAAGPLGWQKRAVDVSLRALDAVSGVDHLTVTLTGAGAAPATVYAGSLATVHVAAAGETTVTYFATDRAGNAEAPKTLTVRIDLAGPTTTASGPSDWQADRAVISLAASDDLSGVASLSYALSGAENTPPVSLSGASGAVTIGAEGETAVTAYATDVAGNAGAPVTAVARIDRTPPEVAALAADGWRNTDVDVTLQAADALSGVAELVVRAEGAGAFATSSVAADTATVTVSAEGITTLWLSAVDRVGHAAAEIPVEVRIDRTPPVVTATAPAGWYNAPVDVSVVASDEPGGSGLARLTVVAAGAEDVPPLDLALTTTAYTVSLEGVTTVTLTAEDGATNQAVSAPATVHVDLTLPEVTLSGLRAYTVDEQVVVGCEASDALSGIASSECGAPRVDAPAWSLGLGSHAVSAEATDLAGNVRLVTGSYEVLVTFDSLVTLTERFADGAPSTSGLVAKLRAAEAAFDKGNDNALAGKIGAFRNALHGAVAGGALTAAQAEVLDTLAAALLP